MTSRDIEIAVPGGVLPAYLALTDTGRSAPAVVLLQEIFGVNANMRQVADDHAARGFDAIVPDLFWRQQPGVQLDPLRAEDRDRAVQLMNGMDQALAVDDALAAAAQLKTLAGSTRKVAAVGWCLGGKLAYLLATKPGIAAAVSYYGVAIQGALDQAVNIRVPLLLHIAEDDHLCPPPARKAIVDAMSPHPGVQVLTYPNVGHAFARFASPAFNADAAMRADSATDAFLRETLAGSA